MTVTGSRVYLLLFPQNMVFVCRHTTHCCALMSTGIPPKLFGLFFICFRFGSASNISNGLQRFNSWWSVVFRNGRRTNVQDSLGISWYAETDVYDTVIWNIKLITFTASDWRLAVCVCVCPMNLITSPRPVRTVQTTRVCRGLFMRYKRRCVRP